MESYVRLEGYRTAKVMPEARWIVSFLLMLVLQQAAPAQPPEARIDELNRRRADLVQRARQCQVQLMDLGQDNAPQREPLAAELQSIYRQMRGVETELVRMDEQRRKGLESQIASEQQRAADLIKQADKLRAETADVQRQIERLDAQNRRQAAEIASALEQTRREIRVLEERLDRYGISYERQPEPPAPQTPLPSGVIPRPEMPMTPRPSTGPIVRRNPAGTELNETILEVQNEVRRLRAELEASREREMALEGRIPPQLPGPGIVAELEQLRMRLGVIERQMHQLSEQRTLRGEQPPCQDNPYSVGSAGSNWYPNWGW
jgi:DNA repair exonuclease SbcCD ATPase subunit